MSTITRTKSNYDVPKWVGEDNLPEKSASEASEALRAEPLPETLDETAIVSEMDLVEKCASEGRPYVYSSKWSGEGLDQIKEFAAVCGAKSIQADSSNVSPKPEQSKTASGNQTIKTANAAADALADNMTLLVGDPFHLDSKGDDSHLKKADWQKSSPESKLSHPDVMMCAHSIINLPGGDSRDSRSPGVGRGENSIASPNAIGELASVSDNGERLHKENEDRRAARKSEKGAWQKEMAQKASDAGPGATTRGSVFMTESLNAQPGLKDEVFHTKSSMPDHTAGEELKDKAKEHKASISRPEKNHKEWEAVQGASRHEMNDVFAEELEKRLASLGKK